MAYIFSGLICAYYLAFWACLAGFFAVLLAFFMWVVIDSNDPTLVGMFHPRIEIQDPKLKALGNMVKSNPGESYFIGINHAHSSFSMSN